MTEKRFTTIYDEQSKMMQYVDTQKEEQWAIWNANKTLQIMNELATNCSSLKNENEKLKQFQEQVASVIESKMGDNVCNDYKMEVLKEIWNELELDEVWFE